MNGWLITGYYLELALHDAKAEAAQLSTRVNLVCMLEAMPDVWVHPLHCSPMYHLYRTYLYGLWLTSKSFTELCVRRTGPLDQWRIRQQGEAHSLISARAGSALLIRKPNICVLALWNQWSMQIEQDLIIGSGESGAYNLSLTNFVSTDKMQSM